MTTEKYAKRENRTEFIKKAEAVKLMRWINKLGLNHTSLIYQCIESDVIKRLLELKVNEVKIPNVKVTEDEIIYMYKRQGVLFVSKNLGGDYFEIMEKLLKNEIYVNDVPEEYISVKKDEVMRLLSEKSLDKVSKLLNVLPHKIVLLTKIKVKD